MGRSAFFGPRSALAGHELCLNFAEEGNGFRKVLSLSFLLIL
jgi:hypothetical protein